MNLATGKYILQELFPGGGRMARRSVRPAAKRRSGGQEQNIGRVALEWQKPPEFSKEV